MSALNDKDDFGRRPLFVVHFHRTQIWGPFDSAAAAAKWASEKWPGTAQYDDKADNGPYWEVEALRHPNT